jgi:hypothetical protein
MFAFAAVLSILCALAMPPLTVAVPHPAPARRGRAHHRHNVIHQNRPFSTLRAFSLSVAGLNMDDTTFSMSSNVIIFMVNLFPSPSGSHTKTLQMWLNVAHSDAPRRWSFFVLHPSSFLPHPFKCGAKKKGAHHGAPSLASTSPPSG